MGAGIFRWHILCQRKTAHILCAAPPPSRGQALRVFYWCGEFGARARSKSIRALRSPPHPNPLPQAGEGTDPTLAALAPLPLAGEGLG
ncbi:hypothetical protein DX914_06755 [Lysobacter silvisoli]|uniref:Uncharacterized protein n=1 Tax=Lysobacter silvisoli TaxID=2293254 RepID=A0A371K4F5_9GAMM|nr:hypothetical protein DX914_06755 [Lysobacter silvisoli]